MTDAALTLSRREPTVRLASPAIARRARAVRFGGVAFAALVLVLCLAPAASAQPSAVTGPDVTVRSGQIVTLDGSASSDAEGAPLTYAWSQSAGPIVALGDPTGGGAKRQFVAPAVVAPSTLTFTLTVSNGTSSASAQVKVTVTPGLRPSRVSALAGRAGYEDVVAVGRHVYVAWSYRNGGNLGVYLAWSSDAGVTYSQPQLISSSIGGGALLGDAVGPRIAVEGERVYVAWGQHAAPVAQPWLVHRVVVLASGGIGGGTFRLEVLPSGQSDAWLAGIAATASTGANHRNVFVLYNDWSQADGVKLAASQDGAATWVGFTLGHSDYPNDRGGLALAAFGRRAVVAAARGGQLKTFGFDLSGATGLKEGTIARGGAGVPYGISLAASRDWKICLTWSEDVQEPNTKGWNESRHRAWAALLDPATLVGPPQELIAAVGDSFHSLTPVLAVDGEDFSVAWRAEDRAYPAADGAILYSRSRAGGAFSAPVTVARTRMKHWVVASSPVDVASTGETVGVSWLDSAPSPTIEDGLVAVSRDGGASFRPAQAVSVWGGRPTWPKLAAGTFSGLGTVYSAWATSENVGADFKSYVLAGRATGDAPDDLRVGRFRVVQAPWDDSPTQRLAAGKLTTFAVEVTNSFSHSVAADVELTYTVSDGGVDLKRTATQTLTVSALSSRPAYFHGVRLSGSSVVAQVVVNPDNVPAERDRANNSASLEQRTVTATRPLNLLFVPILVDGDRAPTSAQVVSVTSGATAAIDAMFPIDERHSVKVAPPWQPRLPWNAGGGPKVTVNDFSRIVGQLQQVARLAGYDAALGVVRNGWFKDLMGSGYETTVGLAPFGPGKLHAGLFEVRASGDVGAHELAHTYGEVPSGAPGRANGAHFDGLVSPGFDTIRGVEIEARDPEHPPVDFMQWNDRYPVWVSPLTYNSLVGQLSIFGPDPDIIHVAGTIDAAGDVELQPWYRTTGELDLELGHAGAIQLVYRDAGGLELGRTGFDPQTTLESAGTSYVEVTSDRSAFSLRVPDVAGTATVELVRDGVLLASRPVSAAAPTVNASTSVGGAAATVGDTVTVTWVAGDADGDALSATALLSIDGGLTWVPLVSDATDSTCSFVADASMVTSAALVKVMVSDGVNTGEALADPFSVAPSAPPVLAGGPPTFDAPVSTWDAHIDYGDIRIAASGGAVYHYWDATYLEGIGITTSMDQGATFGPVVAPLLSARASGWSQGTDMQWAFSGDDVYLVVSQSRSSGAERRLMLHRSVDNGASFVQETQLVSGQAVAQGVAALGADVYVCWLEPYGTAVGEAAAKLAVSHDGGVTFGTGVVLQATGAEQATLNVDDAGVYVGLTVREGGNDVMYLRRSLDGGASFGAPEFVMQSSSRPIIATSGPRVYVGGWRYVPTAAGLTFHLSASADYAATFAAPVDLQTGNGNWDTGGELGRVEIAARGSRVVCAWRWKDPARGNGVYTRASGDGGATWGAKLSPFASLPETYAPRMTSQGDSVYLAAAVYDVSGAERWRTVVATSDDVGVTFGTPQSLPVGLLHGSPVNFLTAIASSPGRIFVSVRDGSNFPYVVRGSLAAARPAVEAGPDLSIGEGQTLGFAAAFSAADPAVAAAVVEWGDGLSSPGEVSVAGGVGVVRADHTYARFGTYTVKITLDAGGVSASDTTQVVVDAAAPSLQVPSDPLAATQGVVWRPAGLTYADTGWAADMSATVDWGDGTSGPATVEVTSPGGAGAPQLGRIDAEHAYAQTGTYVVTVAVLDGVASASKSFSVEVTANKAPTADAGGPYTLDEGGTLELDGSRSSDPDRDEIVFDWVLDGVALGGVPYPEGARPTVHQPDDGEFAAALTVDDGRGGIATAEVAVTVRNVAPEVLAVADLALELPPPLAVADLKLAEFRDPGVLDTHTALVEWGDGSTSAGVVDEAHGVGAVVGGHTYTEPGDYVVTVSVMDKDGGVARDSFTLSARALSGDLWLRVGGSNAHQTALAASRALFPDGGGRVVVLANGGRWSDELAAVALAGRHQAPLLYVGARRLPSGLAAELARLDTRRAVIVGGRAVVSPRVASLLRARGIAVKRISGATAVDTAVAAARRLGSPTRVFVVADRRAGASFAAASLAYSRRMPVLLTSSDALSRATARMLRDLRPREVVIVGGTRLVSRRVERAIDRLPGIRTVTRWSAASAGGTAVAVAEGALARGWVTFADLGVTDPGFAAVAISAGAAQGRLHGALLFTARTGLGGPAAGALTSHKAAIERGRVYGGTAVVSDAELDVMRALVR